jgi:hypothetical protein
MFRLFYSKQANTLNFQSEFLQLLEEEQKYNTSRIINCDTVVTRDVQI